MKVYLDACCLQRPMDDQTQPRIHVETEAVLAVLSAVEAGEIQLIGSDALEYEIANIPNQERRAQSLAVLSLASTRSICTDQVIALAEQIENMGIRSMDALHLALASVAHADFFVTCDDFLLRKGRQVPDLHCKVVSIYELVQELQP